MLMNGLNVIEFLPHWIKGAMVCLDVLHIVQKGQIVHTDKKKKEITMMETWKSEFILSYIYPY